MTYYSDVYIIPQYSTVTTRTKVDVSSVLDPEHKKIKIEVPVISANMDTVTNDIMAAAIAKAGAIGALHRFMSIEENVRQFKKVGNLPCLVSVGVNRDSQDRFLELYKNGARHFIIDIAHGHHVQMKKMINWIKKNGPDAFVMAGNVATPEGAIDLVRWGADSVKIGIGPGAVCTTKNVTGVTVPQFTAVRQCVNAIRKIKSRKITVVADGGVREIGDIAKALGLGADFVMCGRLFASCHESAHPGLYRGMACYSDDTEILTNDGWQTFSKMSKGVKVATITKSGEMVYQNPISHYVYDYSGEMVKVDSKSIDLLVTPNHRMYVADCPSSKKQEPVFRFVDAEKCKNQRLLYKNQAKWTGDDKPNLTIGNCKFPTEEWLDFFGFWLGAGKCHAPNIVECYSSDSQVTQHYVSLFDKWNLLSSVNERLGKNDKRTTRIRLYSKDVFKYLKPYAKASTRAIPKEIKQLSSEHLQGLLKSISLGQGLVAKNYIYASSTTLRDDLYEVGIKCGLTPFYTVERKKNATNESWKVSFERERKDPVVDIKNYDTVHYDGKVYCVEVPNGTLCVRRNGKHTWCGNSLDAMKTVRTGNQLPTPEGKTITIENDKSVNEVVGLIRGGLRSAFSYSNAYTLEEFHQNCKFGFKTIQPTSII